MWSSDFSRSPRLPYPSLPSRVYVETRLRRWRRFMAVCIYREGMKISFFFFFFFLEWCNLKKFRKFFVTIFVWKLFDNSYLWIFNYSSLFKDILLFFWFLEYLFLGKWCACDFILYFTGWKRLEDLYGGRVSTLQPSHLSIDFEHRGCVAEHVVPECTLENIRLTYFIQWILI